MKTLKRLISLSIVIVIAVSTWAVPAYRGWQERTLTDGTPITVRLVGDEFYHYWETKDGKIATMQGDGTFVVSSERRPSSKTIKNNRAKSPYMVRPIRKVDEHNRAPRGLVILVNFANVSFQTANNQAAFNDLMNSTSYTHNGAYGSVREYFRAQSNGAYVPDFDVVGPITLSNNRSTYGANTTSKKGSDVDPAQMIADACTAVNSTVNFATYDNDNDGYIDFVYVIYAGEGEADGGPAESVWPHNWYVKSGAHINCQLDGKWLDNYACSAELNHSDGSRTGIGTIAHEFGHVIGMPDYYDTDYGTNDDDGVTPYKWSIMDQGSYSNEGRTPPNYSIFDKYYMGWATPKFLAKDAQANVTMTTGYSDGYQITGGTSLLAYSNTNTIYYIENRQKTGWDAYIPGSGMLVWKVKYSQTVWEDNEPNNEAGNPRYTIVPADGKSTNYGRNASDLFPTGSVTSYTPFTGCALTEIAKSSSNVTFKYNGGVSATEWSYTLYGDHCTYPDDGTVLKNAALNLTITPSSGYTLADASCWEVTMGGTPLTYGTDFTYNTGTGAFSIASVTGDVEILVEGKRTVTWNVAGVTNTTFFSEGAALVLPTKPADCSGSGGKKFVGWTANSTVTGSAPADLFSTAGTKTVTANTTYYAVYATASGGGGSGAFDGSTAGNYKIYADVSGTKYYATGTGSKISSTTTVAEATEYTFSKVTGGWTIQDGSTYITYSSSTNLGTNASAYIWTISAGTEGTWRINSGTSGRAWIYRAGTTNKFGGYSTSNVNGTEYFDLEIEGGSGTTYSDYSLTCTTCTLSSIALNTSGATTVFTQGDAFSADGLVVTASYSDCSDRTVSPTSVSSPDMSTTGVKTITVSYTEGEVTRTNTYNITVNAAPTYKIRFYDGATKLKEEDLVSGATATPPSNPAGCTEYTFYGWWTETLASSNTTAHKVTDFTVSGAQDYYAVYSHTVTSGGGAASLTKQGSTSSFAAGDNIVIVAKGTTYALYQETFSTSYVKNWSFENSAATVGTDAKNYVTLATAATSGKWYLGDATNGYLYNTSGGNELYVKTDGSKAEWTISWNAGQSAFTIVGGRNLSCRTDLTGGNANKYRSSNGTGTCYFDIYKYSSGGSSTTYYTTTAECVECTNKVTLTKGTPSNGTFALDKADGEYNNCAAGGLVVTVSGITPADGYRFKEITQTGIASGVTIDQEGKTVTYAKDVAGSSTINVLFELIPTYTVTWSSNGDDSNTAEYHEGDAIVFPSSADGCDDKTFMGWVSATIPTPQDEEPTFVTSATMPAHAVTYYAVFADEDGSGAATLTKMVAGNTLANGDKIVIVAHGTTVALYQETANTSYVQKWTFDNNVVTVAADDKKWITVSTATGGWYLGDATNGYLNNSNNNLYCDGDQSIWTLDDNSDGTFNLIGSSGYYLSYRSDLTESNKLWRGGGTNGSNGVSDLDIYKYSGSGTSYSGYTTSCVIPTEVTVNFDANGGTGTMTPQVMDYNTATALTANTFTREGYSFQGWATASGGAKVYNDEASVTLKKNTTLYAVWQKNSYTITLVDPAHGSIETSPATTAEYGATVTVTVTPSGGYTFGSMTVTNNTTSGTVATSGSGATQTFTMPASDVTITATVTEIPTYTVTWSSNGDESNQVNYYEGDAIVFPGTATGCEGKTFMGWSAVTVAEQDVAPAYTTSATMPAHDVTYYAVFAEASSGSGTPVELINEEFDNSSASDASSAITSSTFTNFSGSTDRAYKSQYGGLKLGASGGPGYITSKTLDLSSSFTVTMDVAKYGTDGGNIVVTIYNNADVELDSKSILNANFGTGKSLSFDAATSTSKVEIATSSKRAYIDNVIITRGGGTTYSGYSTTCGASISAQNIGWMTTAAGQKVKRVINVSAKNFDEATTLTATCDNSNFHLKLGETAVPAGSTGLTTTLTVEYIPTASNEREENVEIVLTAADKTRTITVSGRSVPDDFLLITKKSSTWYALPANMGSAGQHDGVEVSPNDASTPTAVAVSPSTLLYNLASVASSEYAANGNLVRLVGNDNKCLWSSSAAGDSKVNIRNYAALGETNGTNYEWDLKTTDGVHYFVECPANAEYAEGRRLGYGTKFGMYKEETVFFIVQAGCTSQPGEVNVSPRRVDATFSWVSNTTEMHIDLYTNDAMTEGHLSRTASSSPYVFHGLAESTDYWYKLTPGSDTECAVTGTFKTSGPIIDIVEWHEDEVVLFIDKGDINPVIVIDGQEEHGSITGGGNATELFFAKYFEGAGSMKLVSVFNGTKEAINLTNYSIIVRMRGSGGSWSGDVPLNLSSLGSINAGQEIIFFSRPLSTETALDNCSSSFLDDKVANSSSAESNPRWVECDGSTFPKINFNGNDPILLKKSGDIIDIIGSQGTAPTSYNCLSGDNEKGWAGTVRNMDKGKSPSDPVFDAFYAATTLSPVTTQDSIDLLTAFGINLDDDEIALTTARCILFRDKRVTSGDSAVLMNETTGTTFVTFTNHDEFKSEWYGRSVCMNDAAKTAAGVTSDAQATCNSYQDIANMDYNQYYIDWTNIEEGKELSTFTSDPETKEYTIPITNMSQYACLNLRFQLKLAGEVLTEAAQQVPIVVTGNVDTNDSLFSELVIDQSTHLPSYSHSVDRCRDCNVVVLGTGTLTKGPDSDEKDVPEIGNLKIYPGGKLIVPTGTEYTVNSLAFRRQEDAVSTADVQGTLNVKTAGNHVYLDFRIDPTNWHYFSLPYDCNVADIRYANEEETAVPVLGTNYLLKYYDGEKRAATQAGGCWEMVEPDGVLKKGIGYIFAIPGDGKVKTEFRFPMANAVIAEDITDKTVAGVYGYGCDKTYEQVRANHRGWNLVGNPYFLPYTSSIEDPVLNGEIVEDHSVEPWDGHYKFKDPVNDLRYIVEPVNNGWSEYRQVAITDYSMTPFTSYFVQIGGSDPETEQGINFVQSQVTGRSSVVRRTPAEYEEFEDSHPVWCAVTLTNAKGETDETTLLISNDFTDEYDIMNDLVKMRGSYYQYTQITTKPVLASRNNEGEMAFNALPDSSALIGVPLNYFAAFQGEYTFAYDNKYDRKGEVKDVKLLDTKTNTWYDLMSEPYSFVTNREDNTTRFFLSVRIERKTPAVTTDIAPTSATDDRPRKILIDDHVYILRGGAIYDITGKQMLNH